MAQLGPGGNLVLPGGQYGLGMLFGDAGFNLFDQGGGNVNVQAGAKAGGPGGLMGNFPGMLKWGQAGGWVGSGPKTFNPNLSNLGNVYTLAQQDPHLFNSSSIGQMMGLYGGPNTQGAYTRYNDAQGHYQRTMAPFEPLATSAMGADLGATIRNKYGMTQGARGSEYDLFKTMMNGQNAARQNPYLDPVSRTNMVRYAENSAPYARPNPNDWVNQQAQNFSRGPQQLGNALGLRASQQQLTGQSNALAESLMGQQRGLTGQSTGMADEFLRQQQGLTGKSAGLADYLMGQQGGFSDRSKDISQYLTQATAGLNNKYESQLLSDIDTESQKTLANQLQDVQNTMAGAGLGRSGSGQMQMLDAQADILGQANRDKQRTMAQMREAGLGREYSALSQAAGMGDTALGRESERLGQVGNLRDTAFGRESQMLGQAGSWRDAALAREAQMLGQTGGWRDTALGRESQILGQAGGMMGDETAAEQARRSQLLGSGLQSQFQSLEGSRAAERQMLLNSLGDQTQMYEGDMARMLQGLTSSDQQAFQRQMGEQQMRSQGLSDWMRMQGYREQDRTNRLGEMLDMEDRMKASQAEKLASQQYYSMLPWNAYQQMITGISGGAMPSTGRQNPWSAVLPQAAGTALGNMFGGQQFDMRALGLGNYQPTTP